MFDDNVYKYEAYIYCASSYVALDFLIELNDWGQCYSDLS